MAKTKISEFSTTAGNNTDINSINIAEGCSPSGINDAIRELMRQLKEFQTGGAGDSVNSGGDFSVATNKFTVASATGNTAVAGTLGATGDFAVNTDKFTVTASSGNTAVAGTLASTGNFAVNTDKFSVTAASGNTSVAGTLGAAGNFAVNTDKFTVAASSGNTAVAGTFAVTGATTLTGALVANGNSTLGDADTDTVTLNASFVNGTTLKTAKTATNTLALAAYDVDGTAYTNLVTLTAGNTPSLALTSTAVGTINNMSIGATTASTGAFTTLSASSDVTLSGGTANGVLYLNGSKVATSGSALVFDGTNLGIGASTPSSFGGKFVVRTVTDGNFVIRSIADIGGSETGPAIDSLNNAVSAVTPLGFRATQFIWRYASSEAMRLTSTGLGIGTTSPGYKLQVTTASSGAVSRWNYTGGSRGARIEFGLGENASGAENYIDFSGTSGTSEGVFKASGAEVMRINSSGNLGLGVTPSAWGSSFKSFDVPYGSLMGAATSINMPGNAYHNGTSWTYRSTAASSNYQQGAGSHSWYTAASGTAGNAITFTQAATLTSAGDYLVGKTALAYNTVGCAFEALGTVSATRSADFSGVFNRTTSDGGIIQFRRDNTAVGSISVTTSATAYNTSSDYRLKNIDGPLTGSGAFIDALKPKVGTWKADGSKFVGFLAHEVQEVSPGSVVGEKDGEQMQAMEYGSAEFIANIIAELQSLRKRLADAGIA